MKTLTLRIDDALDRWLSNQAEQLGRSKSELAREALEQSRKGRSGNTVHDLMKHVCGVVKGGPRDVATSKKYLKNLGRGRHSS
jgi:predicted DNA-binding protein